MVSLFKCTPLRFPVKTIIALDVKSARGEGARVWVARARVVTPVALCYYGAGTFLFSREKYHGLRQLDRATLRRARSFQVVSKATSWADQKQVYLDLHHIPTETLDRKLGASWKSRNVCRRRSAACTDAMLPGVHFQWGTVGRLQSTYKHFRLLARRECDYSIHGANRLGANSLVTCVYGALSRRPRQSSGP